MIHIVIIDVKKYTHKYANTMLKLYEMRMEIRRMELQAVEITLRMHGFNGLYYAILKTVHLSWEKNRSYGISNDFNRQIKVSRWSSGSTSDLRCDLKMDKKNIKTETVFSKEENSNIFFQFSVLLIACVQTKCYLNCESRVGKK